MERTSNYINFNHIYNICTYNGWFGYYSDRNIKHIEKIIDKRNDLFIRITYMQMTDEYYAVIRTEINSELIIFKPALEQIQKYLTPVQTSLFDIETNY